MRPVLVGELNPYGPDPGYALWPDPPGCAGWRLCHKVLGMGERQYLRTFDRVNLCTGRWCDASALAAATEVLLRTRYVVALGAKVARAFQLSFDPFAVREIAPYWTVVTLPHPSGRCRIWNDVGSYQRARDAVASLLDLQVKEGS